MKKILSLLLVITMSSSLLHAQEDTRDSRTSMLTFNLASPIINYSPRWNIGYTKAINKKWLVGVELGYGNFGTSINFAGESNRIEKAYQLWEVRPQVYYVFNPSYIAKMYVSAELFYINHTDTFFNNTFSINNDSQNIRYDKADYKRIKTGGSLNFGAFIDFSKYIGINPSIGLGLRNRDVNYSNIINPREVPFDDVDDSYLFTTDNYKKITGNEFGFTLALSLKLYYKF